MVSHNVKCQKETKRIKDKMLVLYEKDCGSIPSKPSLPHKKKKKLIIFAIPEKTKASLKNASIKKTR
jgi:hypothetical protein